MSRSARTFPACCAAPRTLVAHVERKLGIKTGESTPDGRIFLKREEECLAACTGAPMMMVDHVYHENLTPEKVDRDPGRFEMSGAEHPMSIEQNLVLLRGAAARAVLDPRDLP